ncbi:unnamed protein product [Phytomonas sp. EM1]|nr:unnamed protein product [Phytomonas sp. EM1]|eukprot:CCW62730.1 unnamed protein product [Phytomonas sp. isolate EM1]
MHQGGGRFSSASSTAEVGLCSMHRRKRLRVDLIPCEEQPNRLRCNPRRECHFKDSVEYAVCDVHNRRRNINQMKEVRKGVWECLPEHLCRQHGNTSAANARANGLPTETPFGQPFSGRRRARNERYVNDASNVMSWAPSATPLPAPSQQAQTSGSALLDEAGAHQLDSNRRLGTGRGLAAERKVWCARHGKLLYINQCEALQDSCYVCRDSSLCLSTPLDPPSTLMEKSPMEVLCIKHHTLRLADFVDLNTDKTGYQCQRGHACRISTLPTRVNLSLTKDTMPASYEANVPSQGEEEEEDLPAVQGYLSAVATDTFVPASGKETVSSFFI